MRVPMVRRLSKKKRHYVLRKILVILRVQLTEHVRVNTSVQNITTISYNVNVSLIFQIPIIKIFLNPDKTNTGSISQQSQRLSQK